MTASKVFFTNLRTDPVSPGLPVKLRRRDHAVLQKPGRKFCLCIDKYANGLNRTRKPSPQAVQCLNRNISPA